MEGFDTEFSFYLHEYLGPYRAIAPAGLEAFLAAAELCGYKVAFFDDPVSIMGAYESLNDVPPVAVNSNLDGTVQGLLPYQVQGFNFLKDAEGGVAMWSTGTGKSVLASALIQFHFEHQTFDIAWFVVKSHNKVNTQRTIKRLTGLDSLVISGNKQTRKRTYMGLADIEVPTVLVTNYEKFRVDHDEMLPLFEDKRVLIVWDEMPTKLKTRTTQLYEAVCSCLYRTTPPQVKYEKKRPINLRQYMLSATPIENDPEDWFNCVRLLDPRVYGPVRTFRNEFVARYSFFDRNRPEAWQGLDKMGLKAAHICHQVDKSDPDIAAQFPAVVEETYYVDWDERDRRIYDLLTREAEKLDMEEVNVLALITVLQMLCDAPSMIRNSAALYGAYEQAVEAWAIDSEGIGQEPLQKGSEAARRLVEAVGDELTDAHHTKLETLRSLLTEVHPAEKVVIFSAFGDALLPILAERLRQWNVSHVQYRGTAASRQAAQDAFCSDPTIRVFLSSDAGSDSIDLQESSVVVHYDLPWKWSTVVQRQNRIHRVTSGHNTVRFYSLLMADSVEDRKQSIINRKQGYHDGVFKGAIADRSASARMSKDDLLYILTGRSR